MASVKTVNGLARANVKTRNGLASANIKTINGVDAVVGGGSPFGGLVSTTNLVDWWPLSESSGNRAGVHASLTLTDTNTVTGGTGGPGSSAYSVFTRANNEYLERADESALQIGTGDFTAVCWFYPFTVSYGPSDQGTLIGKDYTGFEMYIYQTKLGGYLGGVPNGVGGVSGAPTTLSINTWYHGALRRSGTTLQLFLNGATEGSSATNSANGDGGTYPFRLGQRGSGGTANLLNGRMNRVGLWKRALSTDELLALYNSGNGLDY